MSEKECVSIDELQSLVRAFCAERDWDQFHNPKDLAIGLSTESNELLDLFRFKTPEDLGNIMTGSDRQKVSEELADVFFFLLRFAQMYSFDLASCLRDKLLKNAEKYPVDLARGSNLKSDQLMSSAPEDCGETNMPDADDDDSEECLICGAPLEYLPADIPMECAICHSKENSKTRCTGGHYVCSSCHTAGLDTIVSLCLEETSRDPVEILEKMMNLPFCHMHGPEHHAMVGAALLTAYRNAGGQIDLDAALSEMLSRGGNVPGGACGFWGACGAGISSGIFVSIITESSPLSQKPFALSHQMTSKALESIGEVGGPRCCKRDSYLSILTAIDFVRENFSIEMQKRDIVCTHSERNGQCLAERCPFHKTNA